MQRDYNDYNHHTFSTKIYFSLIRALKTTKEAGTNLAFINQSRFYNLTRENPKMFIITAKYFSILNNPSHDRFAEDI